MGPPSQPARLRVKRGRQTLDLQELRRGWPERPVIATEEHDGIAVVTVSQWSDRGEERVVPAVDAALARHRGAPGIVFDVRGNGGGSDDIADQVVGRFLEHPVVSSISFMRLTPGQDFRRLVGWTQPRGPWRFPGRVAVVIDEGCMSACEHFVSGMAEAGALLVGTATDGACGWSTDVELPGGATLSVARTFPLHTGGLPSPLMGIRAREQASRVLGDLVAGRDRALEAALRAVRGS